MNNIKEYFEKMMEIEIKKKVKNYRQLNKVAKKGKILFSGSSLAEQFPINELIQSRGINKTIYNRGIGGDVIEGLIENIDVLIYELKPSKIFINIGSNNIGREDYDENVLIKKYTELIKMIKKELTDVKIYILSYYPVNPNIESNILESERENMFQSRTNKAIFSVNKRLEVMASDLSCTYIDVTNALLDEKMELKKEYTIEGIHLWTKAYIKILDILVEYF